MEEDTYTKQGQKLPMWKRGVDVQKGERDKKEKRNKHKKMKKKEAGPGVNF